VKGISQVLVVIVTAIVLMTTALSVILLVQSGTEGGTRTVERTACTSAVQSGCSTKDTMNTPSPCFDNQGGVPDTLETQIEELDSVDNIQGSEITCTGSNPFESDSDGDSDN
jgi:hypothetical protein